MAEWPPTGYSNPERIKTSQITVLGIAVVIGFPLLYVLRPYLEFLAAPLIFLILIGGEVLGLSGHPVALRIFGFLSVIVFFILLGISFRFTVIPVHERIHYELNRLMGLNPQYLYVDIFDIGIKNPAVLAVDVGTTRSQHIPSSLGPFVVIGAVSFAGVILLDGFAAGLAAFVLVVNSAASAKDFYNVAVMLKLPKGTKFASFIEENGHRSEYAVPLTRD